MPTFCLSHLHPYAEISSSVTGVPIQSLRQSFGFIVWMSTPQGVRLLRIAVAMLRSPSVFTSKRLVVVLSFRVVYWLVSFGSLYVNALCAWK